MFRSENEIAGTTPRSSVAATLVLGLAVGLTACAHSPETSYVDASGQTVTVEWKDYPATAGGAAAEDVLELPATEHVKARYAGLLRDLKEALADGFGLSDWRVQSGDDGDPYGQWFREGGNGYGGESMLFTFNSQTQVTEATLDRDEWEHVIDVIAGVAEKYGIDERTLEEVDPGYSAWSRWEWLFNDGEWLSVSVQDARLDPLGTAAGEAERSGWPVAGVTFSYGITTIRGADRAEFERRAAPFVGLERPTGTHSD